MAKEYPTLLHQWFQEVWNERRGEVIEQLLAEDCLHHGLSGPGGGPVRGRADFIAFHKDFIEAFPDLHIELDEVITEGDKLAPRFTVTGTQNGPLRGQPPTGKKVKFTGSGICTVRDGRFVEVWNEIDFMKMQHDLSPDTPDVE
jgi:steroid delta-isomerase-like uncharacterized protein